MKRRDWMKQSLLLSALGLETRRAAKGEEAEQQAHAEPTTGEAEWSNSRLRLRIRGSAESLWTLLAGSQEVTIAPPSFLVDGVLRAAVLQDLRRVGPSRELGNGISEQRFSGAFADDPSLGLDLVFRLAHDSPIVRFRYILRAASGAKLTGDGSQVRYLSVSLAGRQQCLQIQLSAFNDMLHSYTVAELPISPRAFEDETELVGPILAASDERNRALLIAYEHGAQVPDSFLQFKLDAQRRAALQAVKANYVPGQAAEGYSTVWMQAAAIDAGLDKLAGHYRSFVLHGLSTSGDTRRPYIFYNTWNFQERNKWFNGRPLSAVDESGAHPG